MIALHRHAMDDEDTTERADPGRLAVSSTSLGSYCRRWQIATEYHRREADADALEVPA